MSLYDVARQLTEEFFPQTLEIGMVCQHPSGRTVKIVGGQYWGAHGLSNFWEWREVKSNGKLSKKLECGYGWKPKKLTKKKV